VIEVIGIVADLVLIVLLLIHLRSAR